MKITQLRNATAVISIGGYRILVDPMLAPKHALPPLKVFGRRERNPVVDLPPVTASVLASVTHCLITHCQKGHFDHLDGAGRHWLRTSRIPVICTPRDAMFLEGRGLNVQPLPANHHEPQTFLDGLIRTVPCMHGTGMVGRFMEHGVGYFIDIPGEPSLYVAGDTVFTPVVRQFIEQYSPCVSLVPAGGARFDLGDEIIMGMDDVLAFTRAGRGITVANHLEALSHCPVTRTELAAAAARAGLTDRLLIPEDGETVEFSRDIEAMRLSATAHQ